MKYNLTDNTNSNRFEMHIDGFVIRILYYLDLKFIALDIQITP